MKSQFVFQDNQLGLSIGGHSGSCYVHQLNRVNSHNGTSSSMTIS